MNTNSMHTYNVDIDGYDETYHLVGKFKINKDGVLFSIDSRSTYNKQGSQTKHRLSGIACVSIRSRYYSMITEEIRKYYEENY